MPPPTFSYPGVYVEERPSTVKPIEGVPTSRTGFLGPAARGPVNQPIRIRSFAAFQRKFGRLATAPELGDGVSLFFANGGQEAWVVRIARRPNARQVARGLAALERIAGIHLLALPGVTRRECLDAAIAFARKRRAFFIADAPAEAVTPEAMLALAGSGHFPPEPNAAVYYPWLQIADPANAGQLRRCAPSGAVAGVFARTDATRGIWKAPSGAEAHLSAVAALTPALTNVDNERLNARAINCLRTFPNRGPVVWGARTLAGANGTGSPEWKYINVRRLFLFLEESIEQGTQWTVFEPNGEALWAQVRGQVEEFLTRVWRDGALQGTKLQQAFFVRCDRTTMTQDDIDNGRLVMEMGIAPLRPAEFVIFRIGQWTRRDPPP